MRLYCPCLNVSVAVQESVTQHAPPPETLLHACRWPASPVACVRLARTLTASLTVAQPELCRHSTTPPHCTLVECLNCRTVVLAAPESDNPADVFVHPGLIVCSLSMIHTHMQTHHDTFPQCSTQDLNAVGTDALEQHIRSALHSTPPEGMVFSPAFRMYVRAQTPDAESESEARTPSRAPHATRAAAFSALQQHVQTYLEHEQHLMSARIAFVLSLSFTHCVFSRPSHHTPTGRSLRSKRNCLRRSAAVHCVTATRCSVRSRPSAPRLSAQAYRPQLPRHRHCPLRHPCHRSLASRRTHLRVQATRSPCSRRAGPCQSSCLCQCCIVKKRKRRKRKRTRACPSGCTARRCRSRCRWWTRVRWTCARWRSARLRSRRVGARCRRGWVWARATRCPTCRSRSRSRCPARSVSARRSCRTDVHACTHCQHHTLGPMVREAGKAQRQTHTQKQQNGTSDEMR